MEKLKKLESRAQSNLAAIIAALLSALVAWTWQPLLIVAVYVILFFTDIISWYVEKKRQIINFEFKKMRDHANKKYS